MKLILLPGMDGTGELFDFLLPALSAEWHAEVISFPTQEVLGYAELQEYVRERVPKNEPYVILAESMSSALAVMFAGTRPAGLVGVVLSVGFVTSPVSDWARRVPESVAKFFFSRPMPKWFCRVYLAGMDAPIELVDVVQQSTAKNSWQVMNRRRHEIVNCDARAALQQIEIPMLYLQGRSDRTVPARCGKLIKKLRPQTEMVVINGPHLILERSPQETVVAMRNFLAHISSI